MSRSTPVIELAVIRRGGPVKGNSKRNSAMFLDMTIEGKEHYCMVDTGASHCFMSSEMREQIPEEAIYDATTLKTQNVRFGDRTQTNVLETIRLKCGFDGICVYYDFCVMESLTYPIILGRDILRDLQAEIRADKGVITLFNGNPVSVKAGTWIKPLEEQIVIVEPWKEIKAEKRETVTLEPSGITIAGVENAINYANQNWWLRVANFTEQYIYLDRNDIIAYAHEVEASPLDAGVIREVFGVS